MAMPTGCAIRRIARACLLSDEFSTVCMEMQLSQYLVCQPSGLSTIGDILRHRRLSLFDDVARMDHRVPTHDALRLMVKAESQWLCSWRRSPGRPRNV